MLDCEWKPTRQPSRSSPSADRDDHHRAVHGGDEVVEGTVGHAADRRERRVDDGRTAGGRAMLGGVGEDIEPRMDITRRQLLLGSGAAVVAIMAGCSSDDAADGTTTTPSDGTAGRPPRRPARRPVHARRGVGRPAPGRRRALDPAGPGPARRRRPGRHAGRGRRRGVGGGERRRPSTRVVRSGVGDGRPGPRPRGARRRRRPRAGAPTTTTGSPSASTRARSARTADAARRVAGALRARGRQLPVVRDGRLRRLPAPARRGRRPRAAPRRLHLRVRRRDGGRADDACPPTSWRASPTTGSATRSYRLDEDLRNAHHRFPFVLTWDDHEVANNYSGDELRTQPGSPEAAQARKAAAYQAWWEHLPVRVGPPDGSELVVHQHLDVGDLARLYLLDERQYSDLPPCRDGDPNADDFGDCDERLDDRTLLGETQEAWFGDVERSQHRHLEHRRQPRGARRASTAATTPTGPPTTSTPGTASPPPATASSSSSRPSTTRWSLTGDYHAGMLHRRARAALRAGQRAGGHRADGPADLLHAVPRRHHRSEPAGAAADQRPRLPRRRRSPPIGCGRRSRCWTTSPIPPAPSPPRLTCTISAGSPEATIDEG